MTPWLTLALMLWLDQMPGAEAAPQSSGGYGAPASEPAVQEPVTDEAASYPPPTAPAPETGEATGVGGAGTPSAMNPTGAEYPGAGAEQPQPMGETTPATQPAPGGETTQAAQPTTGGTASQTTQPVPGGTATQAAQPGTTGAGATAAQAPSSTGATQGTEAQRPAREPTHEEMAKQLEDLQAQVQTLQQQLEERGQQVDQNTERTQALQQDFGTMDARAQEVDALRQQRLAQLGDALNWMIAAETELEAGGLDVDDELQQAELYLGDAMANASDLGKGETVVLMRNARALVANARESVSQRDVYTARRSLQTAGYSVALARQIAMSRPDVSMVTPSGAGGER
ncbi:hypothetical protein P2318_23735 [Myxococcaceae bacterium GXIMD 01537]